MMAPHWLDDVFQVPDKAGTALPATDRFKEAVAKAQAAAIIANQWKSLNADAATPKKPATRSPGITRGRLFPTARR